MPIEVALIGPVRADNRTNSIKLRWFPDALTAADGNRTLATLGARTA
jgi:hypothetical protein